MESSYSYCECFDSLDDEHWSYLVVNDEDDIPGNDKSEYFRISEYSSSEEEYE